MEVTPYGVSTERMTGMGPSPTTREFSQYKLNPNDRLKTPLIGEEASIWRFDEEYKIIRMPYELGQPFEKELEKWPTPFYIRREEIKAVYRWQDFRQREFRRWDDLLIFESVNGLRIYRPLTGEEIKLPQEAANFVGVTEIRVKNKGDQLWVKNKEGYLVLDREGRDYVKGSKHSGIMAVAFDSGNNVWGLEGKDWKLYYSNSFVDPRHNKARGVKITVFARESVPVTAVDNDGYIYYQKDGDPWLTKYTIQLPKDIQPSKIKRHDNAKVIIVGSDGWSSLPSAHSQCECFLNPSQLLPQGLTGMD